MDIKCAEDLRKQVVGYIAYVIENLRRVEALGRETAAPRVEAVDVEKVIAAFPQYLHEDLRRALGNI